MHTRAAFCFPVKPRGQNIGPRTLSSLHSRTPQDSHPHGYRMHDSLHHTFTYTSQNLSLDYPIRLFHKNRANLAQLIRSNTIPDNRSVYGIIPYMNLSINQNTPASWHKHSCRCALASLLQRLDPRRFAQCAATSLFLHPLGVIVSSRGWLGTHGKPPDYHAPLAGARDSKPNTHFETPPMSSKPNKPAFCKPVSTGLPRCGLSQRNLRHFDPSALPPSP